MPREDSIVFPMHLCWRLIAVSMLAVSYVDHVLAVKALPGTPAALLALIKIQLPRNQRPILAL